jgi:hypothetical protein
LISSSANSITLLYATESIAAITAVTRVTLIIVDVPKVAEAILRKAN